MSNSKPVESKFKPIMVPEMYGVVNGFSGLLRDIILQIAHLLWFNTKALRAMFGMCQNHYLWGVHKFFLKQPINLNANLLVSAKKDKRFPEDRIYCTFPSHSADLLVTLQDDTVYADACLKKDIYRWDIQIKYAKKAESIFWIGAVYETDPKDSDEHHRCCLWRTLANDEMETDKWSFRFGRSATGAGKLLPLELRGAEPALLAPPIVVPDKSRVGLEFNGSKKTLSLFVGNVKVPYVISVRLLPVFLGVAGRGGSVCTSLSFRRLPAATPSSVVCKVCWLSGVCG